MSGRDRSCRHPVNKLFIFPQPCLPNHDKFFHSNRNKTSRTHIHKIVRGKKKKVRISPLWTGGPPKCRGSLNLSWISLTQFISLIPAVYWIRPELPNGQLRSIQHYSFNDIVLQNFKWLFPMPENCTHNLTSLWEQIGITYICPYSTCCTTINLKCQLAPCRHCGGKKLFL